MTDEAKPTKISALVYRVLESPRVEEIEGNLESMQRLVGGYIEELSLGDGLVLICNEDGRSNNPPNRHALGFGRIYGNFFVCRFDGDGEAESIRLPEDEHRCRELIS